MHIYERVPREPEWSEKGLHLSLECQHLMAWEMRLGLAKETKMEKLGAGGKLGVYGILQSQWEKCFKRECCVECCCEQSIK